MEVDTRNPLVSIIVLSYNRRQFLRNCITSVLKSDYSNFEVIVIDNGSTDGSPQLVEKYFSQYPNVKLIVNKRNLGFAEGNTLGVKIASGAYIVFLNDDTEVESSWLRRLLQFLETDKSIGTAQSKVLSLYDRRTIASTGGFIDYLGWSHDRGRGQIDEGQYDNVSNIFYANGSAMIVRRDVLKRVGFFDTDYFMYCEDVDLCWRIWLAGLKVVYVPSSVVFHAISGGKRVSPTMAYLTTKNSIATLLKNYETMHALMYSVMNMILRLLTSGLYSFSGNLPFALAYIKAIFWVIKNFKAIWVKHGSVQMLRVISDKNLSSIMLNRLQIIKHLKGF